MGLLLHIETATTVCSVALSKGQELLASSELDQGYTHAENLHVFIQEVLQQCGVKAHQLDAIAVSKGPGSYTGLRIGVSTAKGLAYALNVPLLSIDTLQLMAAAVTSHLPEASVIFPMIDARRMEVYGCAYNKQLEMLEPVEAIIVEEHTLARFREYPQITFCGDGMPKCRELLSRLPQATFADNIKPSASNMVQLANIKFLGGDFENTAYFEPFYLKDFLITKSKSANRS